MSEQKTRPPFAERLKAGLQEGIEWARGEKALRITEYIDGERQEPQMLTRQQLAARRAELQAKEGFVYDSSVDAMSIRWSHADIAQSDEIEPGIILDYNADGQVVGVEILNLSERMKQAAGK